MITASKRRALWLEATAPEPGVRYRQAEFHGGYLINRQRIADAKATVRRARRRKSEWRRRWRGARFQSLADAFGELMGSLVSTFNEAGERIVGALLDAFTGMASAHPRPCPVCGTALTMQLRKDVGRDRWFMACSSHTEVHGPCSSDPNWARIYGSKLWTGGHEAAEEQEPHVDQHASTLHSEPYYDRFSTEVELACDWRRYIVLARHRLGLSQAELARRAGISASYVSRIETARTHSKDKELLLIRTLATTEPNEPPKPHPGD